MPETSSETLPLLRHQHPASRTHAPLLRVLLAISSVIVLYKATIVPSLHTYTAKTSSADASLEILRTVRVDIDTPNARIFTATATFDVEDNGEGFAFATFNDSVALIGWSQLWVRAASMNHSDRDLEAVMYAAGYAEGALTHHRLYQHYYNTYSTFYGNDTIAPPRVNSFLADNLDYLQSQIDLHKHEYNNVSLNHRRYWRMIGGVLAQIEGLTQGYNDYCALSGHPPLSVLDLFFLNSDGDLEDLIPQLNESFTRKHKKGDNPNDDTDDDDDDNDVEVRGGSNNSSDASQSRGIDNETKRETGIENRNFYARIKSLKCSALIRVLPRASDILWGHTTWDTYSAMNKMFKHYDVPLPYVDGRRRISMSSSPGYISSVDDWYLLDNGLAIMETTNGVYNKSLYRLLTPLSVLSWMRYVCMYLAMHDIKHNECPCIYIYIYIDTRSFTNIHVCRWACP
jgi:hypothetical protein